MDTFVSKFVSGTFLENLINHLQNIFLGIFYMYVPLNLLWGLLLLLLNRFSRVRLCATPQMAAHQAPPSLGFSRPRTLKWVAISFSSAGKWKVKVKSLSRVRLLATPWTAAYQAPLSMGISRLAIAFSWGLLCYFISRSQYIRWDLAN